MKALVPLIILALAGCTAAPKLRTPPPLPVPAVRSAKILSAPMAIPAPPGQRFITWTPNYVQTNEATVIECSPSLTAPVWSVYFIGATNRCPLTNNQPAKFFRAYNTITNL